MISHSQGSFQWDSAGAGHSCHRFRLHDRRASCPFSGAVRRSRLPGIVSLHSHLPHGGRDPPPSLSGGFQPCSVGARYYRLGAGRKKWRMREKSGSRRWQGKQETNLRYEGPNLIPCRLATPLCNALEAFGESGDTPIPFLERHPRFSATPVPGGGGAGVGPPLSPAPSLTCTPWGAGYPCSAARADTPIYCGLKTAYCEYSMHSLSLIAPQWFASSFNSIESLFC